MVSKEYIDYPDTRLRLATLECVDGRYVLKIEESMEQRFKNWKIYVWYGNGFLTHQFRVLENVPAIELCVNSAFEPKIEGPVSNKQIAMRGY